MAEPTKKLKTSSGKLDFFQILKQGTSFSHKEKVQGVPFSGKRKMSEELNLNSKKAELQSPKLTGSPALGFVPLRKRSSSFSGQKYNPSDSEAESELNEIDEFSLDTPSTAKSFSTKRKARDDSELLDKEKRRKQAQKQEKVNLLYKQFKIKIEEKEGVTQPLTNFTKIINKLNLDQKIVDNLKKAGYKHPTPIQMVSIPLMNKSQKFQIRPSLLIYFAYEIAKALDSNSAYRFREDAGLFVTNPIYVGAVILAPTFELSEQIEREINYLLHGVKDSLVVKLVSHLKSMNAENLRNQIQNVDILITTPLKFLKIVKRTSTEILTSVEFLVWDEADKYFELGLATQIRQIISKFKDSKCIFYLFSATIQHAVEELMTNVLEDAVRVTVGGKNNVLSSIEQKLVYTSNEYGKLLEIKNIINRGEFDLPVLIFLQSKERAKELYEEMQSLDNIKTDCIHADLTKEERETAIENFRLGKIWCLICTELLGRGIDFKGVNLVINYDLPNTIINYIHRVGRTGRANRKGKAITFFTDVDKPLLRSLGNLLKMSGCQVPEWILQLPKITKKEKKKLEKFPAKRETISTKIEKNVDPEFKRELKLREKIYQKKLQKLKKQQEVSESMTHLADENTEQIIMKHISEDPFKPKRIKKKKKAESETEPTGKLQKKRNAKEKNKRKPKLAESSDEKASNDDEILSDF